MTVLILGGTAEARELAGALDAEGTRVVSSLAGRVARPRLPAGEVRIGGFGGAGKLHDWLRENEVAAVIDATHPFAEKISASAARACPDAGVPLLRLERPGWSEGDGDEWHWVDDLTAAAALIPALGRRAFLTTGRQGLTEFAGDDETWFLIRCVDPPHPPLPRQHELLLDRGPYTRAGELTLIEQHAIDVVVTKGGITGAQIARDGLGATSARVRGQVLPGVSVWDLWTPDGRAVVQVVVPGIVGDDDALDAALAAVGA